MEDACKQIHSSKVSFTHRIVGVLRCRLLMPVPVFTRKPFLLVGFGTQSKTQVRRTEGIIQSLRLHGFKRDFSIISFIIVFFFIGDMPQT